MTRDELMLTLPAHLAKLGIPRDIASRLLEPLDVTPALADVHEWWASEFPTRVLLGGNGCGKSLAACYVIPAHCRDNGKIAWSHQRGDLGEWWVWRSVKYAMADDVASLRAGDDVDVAEHKALLATPLLILDEAGNEDGDGERGIGRLICDRIAEGKRTVVTANMSLENFSKRYGRRVMSRIGQDSLRVVHGPDLRKATLRDAMNPDVTQPDMPVAR